jgi:signal peptidase I
MSRMMEFEGWKRWFRRTAGAGVCLRGGRLWMSLVAAALLGCFIQRFLICFVVVHGRSMAPIFREGQVCLVQKGAGGVTRGDVVIVHDGESQSIKRVVGLPNESLLFQHGKVYVNGRVLPEPYLGSRTSTFPVYQTRFTLGREHVFVMGDNRWGSEDSRMYGPLSQSAILGKVAP